MEKSYYTHPTAIVESTQIGSGTRIWAYAHILKGAEIGQDCNIGDHCFIENGVVVGNCVTIKNGNMLFEGVTLEDGVFVGPHVFFTNDLYPRSPRLQEAGYRYNDLLWLKQTTVRHGASLGAGAIILAGVTIGEYCTVGAGSVVTKDTLPYELVIGNPAKRVGWVCQCGLRLVKDGVILKCSGCGKAYEIVNDNVVMVKKDVD